jgi:uncharacterized membrane protein YdfJ with MMPL/SSD domain
MRCREARDRILEQTLEGQFILTIALWEHLRGCPSCRSFLARLKEVDVVLRAPPLEAAPRRVTRQIMAQLASSDRQQAPFLHWTVWLPMVSLLLGLVWVYITLVWPSGADLLRSLDPTMASWLARIDQWVATQQAMLNAVAISVGAGLLVTLLAIGLGLYVGRSRAAPRHGHSH